MDGRRFGSLGRSRIRPVNCRVANGLRTVSLYGLGRAVGCVSFRIAAQCKEYAHCTCAELASNKHIQTSVGQFANDAAVDKVRSSTM